MVRDPAKVPTPGIVCTMAVVREPPPDPCADKTGGLTTVVPPISKHIRLMASILLLFIVLVLVKLSVSAVVARINAWQLLCHRISDITWTQC